MIAASANHLPRRWSPSHPGLEAGGRPLSQMHEKIDCS
jgi:hypothetical protein